MFLLGDLYMTQDARDLALTAYLEAIEKDEGKNPARALRPASILVSRSAWDEARKLFTKVRGTAAALSNEDELKLLKLESKVAMATGSGAGAAEPIAAPGASIGLVSAGSCSDAVRVADASDSLSAGLA